MGTPRRIQKTIGYPTTDDRSFDTYKEAITHQTDVDLDESCKEFSFNEDDMKKFLSSNVKVVQEYIKHHLTPKKPAEKKTGEKTAAKEKTATNKAAK